MKTGYPVPSLVQMRFIKGIQRAGERAASLDRFGNFGEHTDVKPLGRVHAVISVLDQVIKKSDSDEVDLRLVRDAVEGGDAKRNCGS